MRTEAAMLLTSAVIAFGLFSAGVLPAKAQTEISSPITIRYASGFGPKSFIGKATEDWAGLVKAKSGGKITIQVFPSAQLYNFQAMPEAVASGTIDAGINMTTYTSQLVPEVGVWSLPAIFRSDEDAFKAVDSAANATLLTAFAKKGVQIVAFWPYGGLQWYANKPLRTPADMKGLRMRVNTDVLARVVEAMGGAPAFIEANEVYTAMQRGTIDGYMNGYSTLMDRKLYEVTKYGIDVNQGYVMSMVTFNSTFWNKLPEAARKVLTETALEIQKKTQGALAADELGKLDQAIAKGLVFRRPSEAEQQAWRKAARPAWDDYTKRTGKLGEDLIAGFLKATGQ